MDDMAAGQMPSLWPTDGSGHGNMTALGSAWRSELDEAMEAGLVC